MKKVNNFYLRIGLIIFYPLIFGIFWYVSIMGFIFVESWRSRLSILIFVTLLVFPICIFFIKKKIKFVLIWIFVFIFLLSVRIVFLVDKKELNSKNIYSIYLEGAYYNKYNPWNRVTEKDWGIIGTKSGYLFALTKSQKELSYDYIKKGYTDMNKDENFQNLNSEFARSLNDFIGISNKGSHYFLYIPNNGEHNRLIVYLHGSAGNFQLYPWLFKQIANETESDIVFPSFGFGNWQQKGGVETIQKVIEDVQNKYDYKYKKVDIISLSNGGRGLTRYIKHYGDNVNKVIFLSSIMEYFIIDSKEFVENAKKIKGIYIIHGIEEKRIPIIIIRYIENFMKESKISIVSKYYEGATHMLLFEEENDVLSTIINYLNE